MNGMILIFFLLLVEINLFSGIVYSPEIPTLDAKRAYNYHTQELRFHLLETEISSIQDDEECQSFSDELKKLISEIDQYKYFVKDPDIIAAECYYLKRFNYFITIFDGHRQDLLWAQTVFFNYE